MKKKSLLLLLPGLIFALGACTVTGGRNDSSPDIDEEDDDDDEGGGGEIKVGEIAKIYVSPTIYPQITVGEKYQINAVVEDVNNAAVDDQRITYTSANPEVATVSSTGLVEGIQAGKVDITATSVGKDTVKVDIHFTVTEPNVALPSLTSDGLTKVENGDLLNGDLIQFAGSVGNDVYTLGTYATGNNIKGQKSSISDSKLDVASTTGNYTVVKNTDNTYSFKDENDKYLAATGGTTANQLKVSNTIENNSKFNVQIINGFATVVCADTTVSRNTLCLNPNVDQVTGVSNPIFSCYATDKVTNYSPVAIYKGSGEVEATGVEFDEDSYTVSVTKSITVSAHIIPSIAAEKTITYSLTDVAPAGCATIEGNRITGVAVGTAKVVATTSNGKTTSVNLTIAEDVAPAGEIVVENEYELTAESLCLGSYGNSAENADIMFTQLMKNTTGGASLIQGNPSKNSVIYNSKKFSKPIKAVVVTLNAAKVGGTDATASFYFGTTAMPEVNEVKVGKDTSYPINQAGTFTITPQEGSTFFRFVFTNYASYYESIKFVFGEIQTVGVTGVEFAAENYEVNVGGTVEVGANVTPSNATDKAITYSLKDVNPTGAATINGNTITGVAVGTATVVATSHDGNYTDEVALTIKEAGVAPSFEDAYKAAEALTSGETDVYTLVGTVVGRQGSSFFIQNGDYAIEVYNKKIDNELAVIGKEVSITTTLQNYNGTIETKTISTLSYTGQEGAVSPITVSGKAALDNINVNLPVAPAKLTVVSVDSSYVSGKTDGKLTVKIGDDTDTVTFIVSKYVSNTTAIGVISGLKADDEITVDKAICAIFKGVKQISLSDDSVVRKTGLPLEKTLNSITIEGVPTLAYTVGQTYSTEGLSVVGHYSDDSSEPVSTTISFDKTVAALGDTKLTARAEFEGKLATKEFNITVTDGEVPSQVITVDKSLVIDVDYLGLGNYGSDEKDGFAWTDLAKNDLGIQGNKSSSKDSELHNALAFSKEIKYVKLNVNTSNTNAYCEIRFGSAVSPTGDVTQFGKDTDISISPSNEIVVIPQEGAKFFSLKWLNGAVYFSSIEFGFEEYKTTSVTSVNLNKNQITLEVNKTDTLVAEVLPADATNKAYTFSVDNENVATVDEKGKVTAVAAGNATITVTTKDGGFTATCSVVVTPAAETGITPINLGGSCKVVYDSQEFEGAAKAGTSKVAGTMDIVVPSGATKLVFFAVGWKGETVKLSITGNNVNKEISLTSDDVATGNTTTFNISTVDDSQFKFEIAFDAALTEDLTLTLSATAGKRFVVWNAGYSTK